MKPETTHAINNTPFSQYLYMALELSHRKWQLGFTVGYGQRPRLRSLPSRDLKTLVEEIRLAKVRFGLAENTPVLSCYEAGRDGFSRRTPSVPRARRCETASGRYGCIATW